MQEFNLISLLEGYGVEIVVGALVAAVAAMLMKKFANTSAKKCLLISFAVGAAITFLIEFFAIGMTAAESVGKGITSGALAIVLTSFTKKLAFLSKDDLKANLEKLLSSIVLSDALDEVVNEIIEKIKTDTTLSEDTVKEVLRENALSDIDESTLDVIAKFILKALEGKVG